MTKRLIIIPARGGSQRIKYKNIKLFKGKPIIYFAIDICIKSKLFHTIHVSTDSKKIKKIVDKIKTGIAHYRLKSLSNSRTPLIEVFKYVVEKYKKKNELYDEIWFLNPCSPLIKKTDLKKSSIFYKKQKNNSVLSVCKYSPPIQWAFKMNKKTLSPYNKNNQKKSSNSFKDSFYDTGNFGIFCPNIFYKNKKIVFSGFEIPRTRSVDIDTMEDWNLAKKLYK